MTKSIHRLVLEAFNSDKTKSELDEMEKEFLGEIKALANPVCEQCKGTGFIIDGQPKGFMCDCVPEPW